MNKSITLTQLEDFEKDFNRDPAKRVAQLAVTMNGVNQSATDPFTARRDRFQFSVELKTGHITNQKGSEHHAGGGHEEAEPGGLRALPELPALL